MPDPSLGTGAARRGNVGVTLPGKMLHREAVALGAGGATSSSPATARRQRGDRLQVTLRSRAP